jgi:hypothetical protein
LPWPDFADCAAEDARQYSDSRVRQNKFSQIAWPYRVPETNAWKFALYSPIIKRRSVLGLHFASTPMWCNVVHEAEKGIVGAQTQYRTLYTNFGDFASKGVFVA